METSFRGLELIKMSEGFRAEAYLCPAGVLTIGYGSTENVFPGMTISEPEAEMKLKQHLNSVESQVNSLGLMLNQNQFDALVSFVYNLGFGNFTSSTLLMLIRSNPFNPAIEAEFMRWIHAGGMVLQGLITRRQMEAQLYFS